MDSAIYSSPTKQRVVGSVDNGVNLKFRDIASNQADAIVELLGRLWCHRGGIESRRGEFLQSIEKRYGWYLGNGDDSHDSSDAEHAVFVLTVGTVEKRRKTNGEGGFLQG